jgi:hypothetical protein
MWLMLIDRSMKEWDLNETYINKLLQNFDPDNVRFNITNNKQ